MHYIGNGLLNGLSANEISSICFLLVLLHAIVHIIDLGINDSYIHRQNEKLSLKEANAKVKSITKTKPEK